MTFCIFCPLEGRLGPSKQTTLTLKEPSLVFWGYSPFPWGHYLMTSNTFPSSHRIRWSCLAVAGFFLAIPSQPVLYWHQWPGYSPNPILGPFTSFFISTIIHSFHSAKGNSIPILTRNCATLEISLSGLTLSSQYWPEDLLLQQTCRTCQAALCHPFQFLLDSSMDSSSLPICHSPKSVIAETQVSTSNPCHNVLPSPPTNPWLWEENPLSHHTRLRVSWSKTVSKSYPLVQHHARCLALKQHLINASWKKLTMLSNPTTCPAAFWGGAMLQ